MDSTNVSEDETSVNASTESLVPELKVEDENFVAASTETPKKDLKSDGRARPAKELPSSQRKILEDESSVQVPTEDESPAPELKVDDEDFLPPSPETTKKDLKSDGRARPAKRLRFSKKYAKIYSLNGNNCDSHSNGQNNERRIESRLKTQITRGSDPSAPHLNLTKNMDNFTIEMYLEWVGKRYAKATFLVPSTNVQLLFEKILCQKEVHFMLMERIKEIRMNMYLMEKKSTVDLYYMLNEVVHKVLDADLEQVTRTYHSALNIFTPKNYSGSEYTRNKK